MSVSKCSGSQPDPALKVFLDLLDYCDEDFAPFGSLPTAADLEASKHANDWTCNPKERLAPSADHENPVHQQIQGAFAGASHAVPTKPPEEIPS